MATQTPLAASGVGRAMPAPAVELAAVALAMPFGPRAGSGPKPKARTKSSTIITPHSIRAAAHVDIPIIVSAEGNTRPVPVFFMRSPLLGKGFADQVRMMISAI